jgi:hypothetical protein
VNHADNIKTKIAYFKELVKALSNKNCIFKSYYDHMFDEMSGKQKYKFLALYLDKCWVVKLMVKSIYFETMIYVCNC